MVTSNLMIARVVKAAAGGLMAIAVLGASSTAHADATCNTLVANLFARASCSECFLIAHHSTNFWVADPNEPADANSEFIGATLFTLSVSSNGHLTGAGSRLHSDRSTSAGQPFDMNQGESISYDFDANGKLTFDGIWGPFDPVCYFDTFMVFPGSTAIEVFSFDQAKFQ